MTLILRVGDLDPRAWAAATWATPFITQILTAAMIASAWTLGKIFIGAHGGLLFLFGAAIVFVVCAAAVAVLVRSSSPRARGFAVSISASYVIVLVGGLIYGFWVVRW